MATLRKEQAAAVKWKGRMVVVRKKGTMQGCVGRFEIKDCQHSLFTGKGAPGFECQTRGREGLKKLLKIDKILFLRPCSNGRKF
jgi:hypothetical protein